MLLTDLGFQVREGKAPGHKLFVYEELSRRTEPPFIGHSIDCGHAPKKQMKMPYVVKTISMLNQYKDDLERILNDE